MSLGKHLGFATLATALLLAAGCSSGSSSSSSSNTIASALQDLDLDAAGTTTVLTFARSSGLELATTANFESNGGQSATSVLIVDETVTIEWDARVTPADQVRALDLVGVSSAFHDVTTSDASNPTFTITSATQNAGLGGDVVQLDFAGPHVVEATAEDAANWVLTIDDTTIDLTGSVFDFDDNAQTLTITLGTRANLHATFSFQAQDVISVANVPVDDEAVDGNATGDTSAPTLLSAEQNLSEDEFGRVIDFSFDKAMDPVFSTQLSHFGVDLPDVAIAVEQPTEDMLRVTFNGPIVPGVEEVELLGLVDLHGNALPDGSQAIAQTAPVVNAFDGTPKAVTRPNAGNDYVEVVTTQAFDPESAEDPAQWTLVVGGNPIDLSTQTLTYDLLEKTLTIELDFDMANGTAFSVTGNAVLEVDGQTFNDVGLGNVAGDNAPPAVSIVTQNRTFDESGQTLDVQLNEDALETSAENLAHWTISGAQTLLTATLLPGQDTVRLVFDAVVIPGSATLAVDDLSDLAGNTMGPPQVGLAVHTDDLLAPDLTNATATAVEGANDDTIFVAFDDEMIESEVELASNWHIESPVGTSRSTVGATIVYDEPTHTATLTLTNGIDLQRGDDFAVHLTGARDLGGNVVENTSLENVVDAETNLPSVHTVYRSATSTDMLIVRFSEPCTQLEDLYDVSTNPDGTRYVLRTSTGTLRGYALSASPVDDGLGVDVSFGIVVANDDTLDVLGIQDLAGNPCFPALALATDAEDLTEPSLDLGQSVLTAVSGGANDQITIKFDRPMSPWSLLERSHYTITTGATTLDLSGATLSFDGTDTVTIRLTSATGNDLQTGVGYDLAVQDVISAQGTVRTLADSELGVVCGGDSTAPSVLVGKVRLDASVTDSLLIEVNEDAGQAAAEIAANYDYNGGNLATSATLVGPRTIRATFGVTPSAGNTLAVTVTDLAGNVSGSILRTVTAADVTGPLVSSVAGTIVPGFAGDRVTISFNEPVDTVTALDASNYGVQTGSTTLDLSGAALAYDGNTNTVTIALPGSQALLAGLSLTVSVSNVEDVSGNPQAATVQVGGSTSGDTTAPAFAAAFANLRADPTGPIIDVRFSEDVSTTYASVLAHWSASGGVSVTAVEVLERDHVRVTLSAALAASGTLGLTGLPDLAGNTSAAINIDPVE